MIKLIVLFSLFLPIPLGLFGQSISLKKDTLTINDTLIGISEFEYFTEKDRVIKQGDFSFNASFPKKSDSLVLVGNTFKGSYHKDLKHGSWQYIYKLLTPASDAFVADYKIQQSGNGTAFIIDGHFNKGVADGEWNVVGQIVKRGEVKDSLFFAATTLAKGQFTNGFKSRCDSIVVKGEVNEANHFQGVWSFEHLINGKKVIEERHYEDGVLIKHFLKKNNTTYEVEHVGLDKSYGDEGELWEDVTVRRSYFDILYYTNFGLKNKDSQELSRLEIDGILEKSNHFLKYSLYSFSKSVNNRVWLLLEGSEPITYPTLKVRKFPYTEEEMKLIDDAKNLLLEGDSIINTYLNDPQVEISRHSYEEVSFYYEVYRQFNKDFKAMKKVFDLLSLDTYKYINREEIFPYIFDGMEYPKEITFEFKNQKKSKSYDFPPGISNENLSIKKLYDHLELLIKKLEASSEVVQPIIEQNKKRAAISGQEEKLIRQKDSLILMFNNKLEDENYNEFHEKYAFLITDKLNNNIKDYAQKPIEVRVDEINSQLKCMDKYFELYTYLEKLPNKISNLEHHYTRTIWNPFTFTDMDEIVKERVYNAYKERILPYLLELLEVNPSCSNIGYIMSDFDALFQLMLKLRNEDTKELEKSLRRSISVDKVLEAFNLEIKSSK
jgi:hypothetical protein